VPFAVGAAVTKLKRFIDILVYNPSTLADIMSSAAIVTWAQPYCTMGGFAHLAPFIPTVLQSLGIWVGLQILSSKISPKLFPQTWSSLKPATRTSWNVHWVALVHAAVITPLTARVWWKVYQQGGMDGDHILARNRLYAFDQEAGSVYAIALGYFIWDSVVSALVSDQQPVRSECLYGSLTLPSLLVS